MIGRLTYNWPWEEWIVPLITFGFRAPWAIALITWRRKQIVERVNAMYTSQDPNG